MKLPVTVPAGEWGERTCSQQSRDSSDRPILGSTVVPVSLCCLRDILKEAASLYSRISHVGQVRKAWSSRRAETLDSKVGNILYWGIGFRYLASLPDISLMNSLSYFEFSLAQRNKSSNKYFGILCVGLLCSALQFFKHLEKG